MKADVLESVMGPSARMRDVRLDVLRGLALLIIFVDHIPGMIFAGLTPQAFGYADAAEAFVIIAGLSAYQAYNGKIADSGIARGALPVLTRVWQLYITHLALVLLVFGISAWAARTFGDPNYLESLALDTFINDPGLAAFGVMTLTFLPNYLDILPLYMVLLTALPLVLLALRIHWSVPLVISAAIYAVAQTHGLNFPNMQASRVWFFNPLAWQFIFVLGVVVAHLNATGALRGLFARRRLVAAITILALAYVIVSLVSVAPWRQIPPFANLIVINPADLPVADKTSLTPLRLIDALAKAWLVAVLIPRSAGWLGSLPARGLALIGRQSLPVFVLGLVLSTVGAVIVRELGFTLLVQTMVVVSGIAIQLGFAALLDWQARGNRRDMPVPDPQSGSAVRIAAGATVEPSTK